MLSLIACLCLAAPAPSLSADAPAGSDLLVRVEVGKVWETIRDMLDEMASFVDHVCRANLTPESVEV